MHAHRFGLGLRREHYGDFLEGDVDVDFVEVISENSWSPAASRAISCAA